MVGVRGEHRLGARKAGEVGEELNEQQAKASMKGRMSEGFNLLLPSAVLELYFAKGQ